MPGMPWNSPLPNFAGIGIFPPMSTIVEADETGTLRLPASLLPHPGPHRRYRVATGNGRVVVDEAAAEPRKPTGFVRKWGGSAKKLAAEGDARLARINDKHLR